MRPSQGPGRERNTVSFDYICHFAPPQGKGCLRGSLDFDYPLLRTDKEAFLLPNIPRYEVPMMNINDLYRVYFVRAKATAARSISGPSTDSLKKDDHCSSFSTGDTRRSWQAGNWINTLKLARVLAVKAVGSAR